MPYGAFSNFFKSPFTVDGVEYKTSEHYYQSRKFPEGIHRQEVLEAPTARECAAVGRDTTKPLVSNWEEIKDQVMREALYHKFHSNGDLAMLLLSTNDIEIVEDSPYDYYWGCGKEGTGKNMLGKLLMELRDNWEATLFADLK